MRLENVAVWQVTVLAETDPGALIRVLQFFQARNLVPRRMTAERGDLDLLEIGIEIDSTDCTREVFRVVVAKIGELPIVVSATARDC